MAKEREIMRKMDMAAYRRLARRAGAEGCVLLKNDRGALPLPRGGSVALFGRFGYEYYKSGVGSGGMVNAAYVTGIADGLRESGAVALNEAVVAAYARFLRECPFDNGHGWGTVPWHQTEMPPTEELLRAAATSDTAVVVIGRTAGEDQDNAAAPGSYHLTDTEEALLAAVCGAFRRTVVVLNVGNIIDMTWVDTYDPAAVLYVWQAGQEGGRAAADVLTGAVNPCGRLTDTIAHAITDYPSTDGFGDERDAFYREDIFVGYRYFETFAPERVRYPFGFGLSYTTFTHGAEAAHAADGTFAFAATVRNTGAVAGREVVQVYVQKPQGALSQPARALVAFAKTAELRPGEEARLPFAVPLTACASFDDSGATGHAHCWVLEAGEYVFYSGADVRRAQRVGAVTVAETRVVRTCRAALAPVRAFERLCVCEADGRLVPGHEPVPTAQTDMFARAAAERPADAPCTGDCGWKLADVAAGRVDMADFLAQLRDEELCTLLRMEGMNSPKVTGGTGGAFGGVTDALLGYGIPIACCTDGPSGIRMDCGTIAFSLPNGTLLACTWNRPLIAALFACLGWELRQNRVDLLLGPGMNLHRNPLNGRNFEYFSEDPVVTGEIAAAELNGLHEAGVSGVIKHFCANNQEFHRHDLDSVVSERALREVYLKGFERAVRAGAFAVMTTYGAVNGVMTASNYDLNTEILRREWGFDGIVMTDWWAGMNRRPGGERNGEYRAAMVRAQNDLYAVVDDAAASRDDLAEGLTDGRVTRGELLRSAANICRTLLRLPVMRRAAGEDTTVTFDDDVPVAADGRREARELTLAAGDYRLSLRLRASEPGHALAQLSCSVFWDGELVGTLGIRGTQETFESFALPLPTAAAGAHRLELYCPQEGLTVADVQVMPT